MSYFYEKLEEVNGVLGDRKKSIDKRDGSFPRDEEARIDNTLRRKI